MSLTIVDGINSPQQADQILERSGISYSICSLVNNSIEYQEMVKSFMSKGFAGPDVEYLYVDNSGGNKFDAYTAYNIFLRVARGKNIILCHQDVLLLDEGRQRLDELIAEIGKLDPNWGLLGNAGGECPGRLAIRISDPHGENMQRGHFPARVLSLDENFIVVRASTNIGLSRDLSGFHFYGTDLSVIADILGYTAYVVDFHLRHKSAGKQDISFHLAWDQFLRKYQRALRPRYVATTCATLFLSGSKIAQHVLNRWTLLGVAIALGKRYPALFDRKR